MPRLVRVCTVHATADDAFPFALQLSKFSFVRGELGPKFEAFRLLLRNEPE